MKKTTNIPLLNYQKTGSGPTVVFLHGMAGSLRYWTDYRDRLSSTHTVITLDLLGFGHSPKPHIEYTADTHVIAILQTLDKIGVTDFTLVGHSMGALIAVHLADKIPRRVTDLVLISVPIYTSPRQSRQRITLDRKRRKYAYYGLTSKVLCTTWCTLLRPISRRVAKYYIKNKPLYVSEDSVLHTWHSFSSSLFHVIEHQHFDRDIQLLNRPIVMLYGDDEDSVVLENAATIAKFNSTVAIEILIGTHSLPLEQQTAIIDRWLV